MCGRERRCHVHRGGEAVVGGLALVDVIVGVDRRFAAALAGEDLVGAPGDHLVDVHVGLGAAAGLPDHQRELIVQSAMRDFLGGFLDGIGKLRVQTVLAVDPRGGLLDQRHGMHDRHRHSLGRAERKVLDTALGLRAPIGVCGDFDVSDAVGFAARVHGLSPPSGLGNFRLPERSR